MRTRFGLEGYGVRRVGSFAGKTVALGTTPGRVTASEGAATVAISESAASITKGEQ